MILHFSAGKNSTLKKIRYKIFLVITQNQRTRTKTHIRESPTQTKKTCAIDIFFIENIKTVQRTQALPRVTKRSDNTETKDTILNVYKNGTEHMNVKLQTPTNASLRSFIRNSSTQTQVFNES